MDDFKKFYQASIRFLSFRPRSEKELRDYLKRKKCDELISQRIVESLTRDKFLNDTEFTRWWVEQRTLIKPKPWRIIKIELKQKGIQGEIVEEFQNLETPIQNDNDAAIKLAQKKLRSIHDRSNKRKVYEKLGRYLAGKGFDWDIVKQAIDRVLEE